MELQLSPAGRRYGYRKDASDHRDYGVSRLKLARFLPSSVDLEEWCGPVKDQGDLGACTAFAGCGMLEFLSRKYDREFQGAGEQFAPVFSPLFLYYKERELDGSLADGDAGSYGRTSCRAMQTFGVCPESYDPYDPSKFQEPPDADKLMLAAEYRSGAYHRILTVDDMKACLASGYVFVIGFTVYESFETGFLANVYDPNKKKESILGGHEVLVIGYDDHAETFKVRNSWGAGWADKGNFHMPYHVAADSDILQDAYIQHLGRPW